MAPPVSQLDATAPTDSASAVVPALATALAGSSPHRFSQVRTALIRALRSSPEAREPLCDALEQLEAIQLELEAYQRAMPPAPARPAPAGRRRARSQAYEVQASAEGAFLIERRPGRSQPFRCPRSTYDAAAEVLAAAGEALPFEELMDRLNARSGHRQPDYRLRVALRFWMTHDAVVRSRTKYRAADRATFVATSRALWAEVEAERTASAAPSNG